MSHSAVYTLIDGQWWANGRDDPTCGRGFIKPPQWRKVNPKGERARTLAMMALAAPNTKVPAMRVERWFHDPARPDIMIEVYHSQEEWDEYN